MARSAQDADVDASSPPDGGAAAYRAQLSQWAQDLALARRDSVDNALAAGSTDMHVKMFTDGNLDKRFNKLQNALEFIAEAFEGFDDLLAAYVREVPLAAYDTGSSDAERFLDWLARNRALSAEQLDYVACQRGRFAVENAARADRAGHVRFQQLLAGAADASVALDLNPQLKVFLNPVHAWSRFQTAALLDEDAAPPANLLFYAAGGEIATAVLERDGQLLLRELALYAPCTLDDWARMGEHADREALAEFCRDLAAMGLAAFE